MPPHVPCARLPPAHLRRSHVRFRPPPRAAAPRHLVLFFLCRRVFPNPFGFPCGAVPRALAVLEAPNPLGLPLAFRGRFGSLFPCLRALFRGGARDAQMRRNMLT
jgi:hypothetical protein